MSDEFIQDVDEDLRREQLTSLWKFWGKYVIGLAVGIVLFVAINWRLTEYREGQYGEQAVAYEKAVAASEVSALQVLEKEGSEGYQILAVFKRAQLSLKENNKAAAAEILFDFAKNANVEKIYRDLATLQGAMHVGQEKTYEEMKNILAPLTVEDNRLRFLSREFLALTALKDGNTEEARRLLTELSQNLELPPVFKERVDQLLGVIG